MSNKNCNFVENKCVRCGFYSDVLGLRVPCGLDASKKQTILEVARRHKKAIDALAVPKRATQGLGDLVAAALSAVGITKERVSKAIGRPCGCAKRQEKLNNIGRRFGIG